LFKLSVPSVTQSIWKLGVPPEIKHWLWRVLINVVLLLNLLIIFLFTEQSQLVWAAFFQLCGVSLHISSVTKWWSLLAGGVLGFDIV